MAHFSAPDSASTFEEAEIFQALTSINGDKAPNPDGFTMTFFQACQSVVRGDIINFFKYFHASGGFGKSLNATFIALITKTVGAVNIKDFRPISLIGKWVQNFG